MECYRRQVITHSFCCSEKKHIPDGTCIPYGEIYAYCVGFIAPVFFMVLMKLGVMENDRHTDGYGPLMLLIIINGITFYYDAIYPPIYDCDHSGTFGLTSVMTQLYCKDMNIWLIPFAVFYKHLFIIPVSAMLTITAILFTELWHGTEGSLTLSKLGINCTKI
jgi:hypothetical protein